MKEKVWYNSGLKKYAAIFMVITAILMSINIIFIKGLYMQQNRDYIMKNTAIIGKMINKHPEMKEDIVNAFTKEADSVEINEGIKLAEKYGYEKDLPLAWNSQLSNYYNKNIKMNIIFSLEFFTVFFGIGYVFFLKLNKRISYLAAAAEKIVEGDFNIKFIDEKEGAISRLEHQFSQMSKRLQLTLEQLQHEKLYLKNIISDISHQLKTPLASLKMLNELMLEQDIEKEQKEEFLLRSSTQLERMEWLIKNLLKLTRIEAGAVQFQDEINDLTETINEVISSLSYKCQEKKQKIYVTNENSKFIFKYDKRWMGEAISNIVKNSIEHTDYNGEIAINIEETPVMIRIKIKDNGEGIAKEDLPFIFQRFYRGKNNIHGNGTGIGLALSKSIIENEHGIITVKSEINNGTQFTLTFIKDN